MALLLWLLQMLLAVFMFLDIKSLKKTPNFYPISMYTIADVLQRFSQIYGPINLKVGKKVNKLAVWVGDTLAVDNKKAYLRDAKAHIFLIRTILEKYLENPRTINTLRTIQTISYALQIFSLGLAVFLENSIIVIAVCIFALLSIAITVFIEKEQEILLRIILYRTAELLDLDQQEQEQVEQILASQKGVGFWYVFFPFNIFFGKSSEDKL